MFVCVSVCACMYVCVRVCVFVCTCVLMIMDRLPVVNRWKRDILIESKEKM